MRRPAVIYQVLNPNPNTDLAAFNLKDNSFTRMTHADRERIAALRPARAAHRLSVARRTVSRHTGRY